MASPTSGAPDLPDYAPVPRASLGPAVNDQGYYVGRVERNLYWVTDGDCHSAFLTTRDGVVLFVTGRLDYAGALAAVVFLSGITFAFIEAPTLGWASPAVLTTAVLISGGLCAAGGLLAAVTITNPAGPSGQPGASAPEECLHCGLDAPPLTTSVSQTTGT